MQRGISIRVEGVTIRPLLNDIGDGFDLSVLSGNQKWRASRSVNLFQQTRLFWLFIAFFDQETDNRKVRAFCDGPVQGCHPGIVPCLVEYIDILCPKVTETGFILPLARPMEYRMFRIAEAAIDDAILLKDLFQNIAPLLGCTGRTLTASR